MSRPTELRTRTFIGNIEDVRIDVFSMYTDSSVKEIKHVYNNRKGTVRVEYIAYTDMV